ncbi:MFS transporter, partial [Rhizobium ruizarguesonis]
MIIVSNRRDRDCQQRPIIMTSVRLPGNVLVAVMIACVATCYGFGLSLFPQIIPDMRKDLAFD